MKTLVIAPHPDDELLGPGGTLLRKAAEGFEIGLLFITSADKLLGWSTADCENRQNAINTVRKGLNVDASNYFNLNLPATQLDTLPLGEVIQGIHKVLNQFMPQELLIPHESDIHTDHKITFLAVASAAKVFRSPYIKRILSYETISETDHTLSQRNEFHPNLFVNISSYLERKIELINAYQSEIGAHPFPRSIDSIKALATLRGSQSGAVAAEAFQVLREIC